MKHISTYLSILGILISSFSYSQFIVIETITDVACFSDADGTINLSVSGGTTPYTYLWDPTVGSQTTANVTDLIAGSYTVTITDATVADTVLSYVVTEPAQLSLTIASTPDCGACTGTATPTGSGGTGFSYQWSNGATNANQVGLCTGIYSLTIVDNNGCFVAENVTISASGGFNITTTAVDDTCGQCIGEISVQVGAGGTSPYFYDWGNGNTTAAGTANETQLSYCMGSYLIQITDSVGCSTMDSVEIFGQGITSINTTITDANCGQSDGSIVTAVVGGITPYLYAWSNGSMSSTLSGVSAGSYQLTVSDAGSCNFVTTINLTDISAPTLSIIPNDASCFDGCDGAASGFASGGTAPYSFLWDNTQSTAGVTALCAGISYGLTVTDNNGCNAIATTIVSAPMQLSVTLLVTNSLCNSSSGNIQSNVSGGTPGYTYFWGDGSTAANAINLVAGSYVLTVMDNNGCSSVASATVSSGSSLTLTSSSNAANCSACDGDATISVTGGVTPYLYAWAQGGSTSALATGLCAGSYSVTVSDFNGCSVDSAITVNSVSGLTGMVTTTDALCSGSADGSASASAISGTTPYSYLWNDPLNQITALANGLAAGAYIVTITDNSGCTYLVNSNISEPTLLVSNNTSNSACGNALGSIVFNVSGGTSPYQYSIDSGSTWLSSTNFDSLSVGLFYAAIRDANLCTIYDSISVDSTSLGVTSTVYQPNYCGQYGTVYAFTNNGTQPYSYSWNIQPQYDYTTSYYNYAALSPGDYTLTVSDALGCTEIVNHSITNLCLPNHISGNVFDDLSSDCVQDAGENSMTGKIVVATPGPYYATTNYAGYYEFFLDSGDYTISIIDDELARDPLCPAALSYDLQLGANDSNITGLDFGFQPTAICSDLSVSFYHLGFRPCFSSWYLVNYSNGGTEIAYNAYIDVVLPPEVTPVAVASWGPYWNQAPYNTVQPDSQNGNTYTYQLGDLSPSTSGSFYILIDISCSAVMGETLCAEARIYPNDGCEPIDSIWDKSSVSVEGRCTSDSLACFTIYNTGDFGNGDMDAPSEYRIYDNNVLVVVVGTFQILGGDSTEICYAAAGNTIRLEADQRPGHPGNSHPNDVIELCGSPNQTTGLVTSMPLDDDSPAIDIACVPVTSSWDPNDKQVTPSGITEEYHFIDSLVTLDYTIRFQNTGTDTAFNVYLIDTISSALDPLTIKSGAASHTYNFTYLATNVVQWYFPWLLLADSNVNEPASHGFINFTIEQRPGNEFGTVIENTAGIYFDFNDPVITNTAFNTVGIPDTFKVLTTSIPVIYNQVAEIKVYPNPFSKSTTFEIAGLDGEQVTIQLFDLTGKRVTSVVGFGKVELDRRELTNGIYFYSVSSETGVLANGKLVIQ